MIEVRFTATADDFAALQRFVISGARGRAAGNPGGIYWRPLAIGIPLGLLLGFVISLVGGDLHFPTAVLTIAIMLIYFLVTQRRLAKAVAPALDGSVLGPKHTSLDDTGLTERLRYHTYHVAWPGILSVDETQEHVFFRVDRCGGYVIPKRAFGSRETVAEFVAFARGRLDAGRARAQTITDPSAVR